MRWIVLVTTAAVVIAARPISAEDTAAATAAASAAARALQLAEQPTWLKLGRYQRVRLRPGGAYRSAVVSDSFFLADRGDRDPHAELEATLAGLLEPFDVDAVDAPADASADAPGNAPGASPADSHVLCRYPARAAWLAERLRLSLPDARDVCPGFRAWAREGDITGASVVFASGYLSNPGSAYGHLLLRFHSHGAQGRHDLLETSINYGAADSEDDPFFAYVAKGLTGGYRSTFTDLEYFNHNRRYREAQLRDVWAYHLNLDQRDIDLLVAHTWEMLGTENKYYFLRQNCAYRIAELVSVTMDGTLVPQNKAWVTPLDIFHSLSSHTRNGSPLVTHVEHLPSRQTTFRAGYADLPAPARRVVNEVAAGADVQSALSQAGLDPQTQAAALDVALDYDAFAREVDAGAVSDDDHTRLLLARLRLPPTRTDAAAAPPPSPHAGQHTSLLQVSPLYNDEFGAGVEFRLRPAYYDLLSPDPGTVPYSELSMFDVRLIAREGDLDLRQIELVRLLALNVTPTGLPNDGGVAWGVRFGVEDRDLSCDDCLVRYAEGAVGKAAKRGGVAAFALLTGRAQALDVNDNYAQAGVTLGAVAGDGPVKASLIGGVLNELDGDRDALPFIRAETRLGQSRRWDVRFDVEHREALETRSRFSFYW